MKIVVDTNIIFSALLSPDGKISDLLINSHSTFEFFSPMYILDELEKHKLKLKKISGFDESEINFLQRQIFRKVDLIDLEIITETIWEKAVYLTYDVDEFDTPFIALALELKSALWTGDKKLINGLSKKGVDWIFTTDIINKIRNDYDEIK